MEHIIQSYLSIYLAVEYLISYKNQQIDIAFSLGHFDCANLNGRIAQTRLDDITRVRPLTTDAYEIAVQSRPGYMPVHTIA